MVLAALAATIIVVAAANFDESACNSTVSSEEAVTVSSPLPDPQSRYHGSPLTCVHRVRPPPSVVAAAAVARIVFLRLRTGELHRPRDGDTDDDVNAAATTAVCVGGHLTIVDGAAAANGRDFGRFCGEAEQVDFPFTHFVPTNTSKCSVPLNISLQIRTYYAEYQDVDLIFRTDRFDDDFEVNRTY
jgi:hypothetical protein